MAREKIVYRGCFPEIATLDVAYNTIYFVSKKSAYAVITQNKISTELGDIYDKLVEVVSLLPPAETDSLLSGNMFHCSSWQGKFVDIGCWNYIHNYCIFNGKLLRPRERETLIWKSNMFGLVIVKCFQVFSF